MSYMIVATVTPKSANTSPTDKYERDQGWENMCLIEHGQLLFQEFASSFRSADSSDSTWDSNALMLHESSCCL